MEERQVKLLNVGLLGLAFMLVFTAFQTLGNVQPIILDSARNESSGGYVDGLFIYDGRKFMNLTVKEGLSDNNIYAVCEDKKGTIWISTENGLNKLMSLGVAWCDFV